VRVYINNRNYVTWPKKMAEKLAGQGHDVIFYDNASTYEPLLEFYENCPYEVVRSKKNAGHRAVWNSGLLDGYKDPYVVTDPDLDIDDIPDDWPEKLLYGCKIHGYKCGFGLGASGMTNPEKKAFFAGRKQRFIQDVYFRQLIDTTFAVYTCNWPRFKSDVVGGISTGMPYVARHLPWHLRIPNPAKPTRFDFNDEIYYYLKSATTYVTALDHPHIQWLMREWELRHMKM